MNMTKIRELYQQGFLEGLMALALFILTLPIANWLVSNVGIQYDAPFGPHLIQVGFGLMAPSGVLVIGLAFCLRDIIHRRLGVFTSLIGIVVGAVIAGFADQPSNLVMASFLAFLLAEFMDTGVYATVVRKMGLFWAVMLSGIVGIIIDTFIFLPIAFGSTDYWEGQLVGKGWMLILAGILILLYRQHERFRNYRVN